MANDANGAYHDAIDGIGLSNVFQDIATDTTNAVVEQFGKISDVVLRLSFLGTYNFNFCVKDCSTIGK